MIWRACVPWTVRCGKQWPQEQPQRLQVVKISQKNVRWTCQTPLSTQAVEFARKWQKKQFGFAWMNLIFQFSSKTLFRWGCGSYLRACWAVPLPFPSPHAHIWKFILKLFSDEIVAHLFAGPCPGQPPCLPRGLPLPHALPGGLPLPNGEENAQSINMYEFLICVKIQILSFYKWYQPNHCSCGIDVKLYTFALFQEEEMNFGGFPAYDKLPYEKRIPGKFSSPSSYNNKLP